MEGAQQAMDQIQALTASVEVGKIYKGRVTSIKDFGAFVEILPGKDGLCHISELSDEYVSSVGDLCKIGDPMSVKVIAIDDQDRVKLSRRAAMHDLGETDPPNPRPGGAAPAAVARDVARDAVRDGRTEGVPTAGAAATDRRQ